MDSLNTQQLSYLKQVSKNTTEKLLHALKSLNKDDLTYQEKLLQSVKKVLDKLLDDEQVMKALISGNTSHVYDMVAKPEFQSMIREIL